MSVDTIYDPTSILISHTTRRSPEGNCDGDGQKETDGRE